MRNLFSAQPKIDLTKPLLPEEIKRLTDKQKQELINKGHASSFYLKTLTGQAQLAKSRPPSANIEKLKREAEEQYSKGKPSFITHELKRLYNLL